MKRHIRGHCRWVEDSEEVEVGETGVEVAPGAEALLAEVDALLDADQISPTGLLQTQLRAYAVHLRRQISEGRRPELTADQAARAAQALIKAEHSDAQSEVLHALAQAAGAQGATLRPYQAVEAETAEVVEYVVLEPDELPDGGTEGGGDE